MGGTIALPRVQGWSGTSAVAAAAPPPYGRIASDRTSDAATALSWVELEPVPTAGDAKKNDCVMACVRRIPLHATEGGVMENLVGHGGRVKPWRRPRPPTLLELEAWRRVAHAEGSVTDVAASTCSRQAVCLAPRGEAGGRSPRDGAQLRPGGGEHHGGGHPVTRPSRVRPPCRHFPGL